MRSERDVSERRKINGGDCRGLLRDLFEVAQAIMFAQRTFFWRTLIGCQSGFGVTEVFRPRDRAYEIFVGEIDIGREMWVGINRNSCSRICALL